ncbi:MAG: hypothetical protein M3Y58_03145 [Chloroflexota bacterium]|nr:hypothetical protein [Chloroflexota bacterium]
MQNEGIGRGWSSRLDRAVSPRAREYAIAAAVFLALTIVFFNPVFRGFTFSSVGARQNSYYPWKATPTPFFDMYPQVDQAITYYPWQVFINRTLRDGSIPLWNPSNFGGQPFLANGQNGFFYPPKFLLSLLVSASWVHDLLLIASVFFSGLAMFALLKAYGGGFAGALLAGVAWMFNTYTLSWLHFEIAAPVAVFLPLAVYCIYRSATMRSWRLAIAAGAALSMIFLGGSVLYGALVSIACGLYALFLSLRLLLPLQRSALRRAGMMALLRLMLIPLTTIGVCAVQVVPSLVLSQYGARAAIPYDAFHTAFAVRPSTFGYTFRAPPLIPPTPGFTANDYLIRTLPLLYMMAFNGLPIALFALIGLFQRRAGVVFGRVLLIGTFLTLIGTPATWLAYHLVPGFSGFVGLGRALFLWNFAVVLLGGIGLDALLRWARNPSVASRRFRMHAEGVATALRRNQERIFGAVSALAVVAVIVTVAQLGAYDRAINPPFEPRQSQYLYPETPFTTALRADQKARPPESPQRFIPLRLSTTLESGQILANSQPMLFAFESVGGFESLVPDRTVALWRVVEGESPTDALATKLQAAFMPAFRVGSTRFDLLPRLGVNTLITPPGIDADPSWNGDRLAPLQMRGSYLGAGGGVIDIVAPAPVSRAYVVHIARYAATPLDALQQFTGPTFDYQHAVILENGRTVQTGTPPAALPDDHASVQYHGVNDATIDVTTAAPGWVVLTDMWDPGWHATIGGSPTDILHADFAFRAVPVPAGTSHITMRYRPIEFIVGAATTAGTVSVIVLVLIGAALSSRRKRRSERLP